MTTDTSTAKMPKTSKDTRTRLGILIKDFFTHILGQIRISQKLYPGIMHFLIFWGMTLLVIGHVILLMQMALFLPFVVDIPRGNTYLVFETISDFAGLGLLLGIAMALFRRLILRPSYLESRWDDYFALILVGLIPVMGYLNEGIRITATDPEWALRSPIARIRGSRPPAGRVPSPVVAGWSPAGIGRLE